MLPDLDRDLRFAVRSALRRPGFSLLAVLTLALGIGAATAVFSIVDAVLLRPLPYKNPERLAAIWLTSTREKGLAKLFASWQDYDAFRRGAGSLESVGAATWATGGSRVLTGLGPARRALTFPATASFFDTLGVNAQLGRTFHPDDEASGCSVVLAHRFWTSSLGADPSIAGRTLTLDEKACAVVGVMPESFSFYPRQTDAWVLLGAASRPAPGMPVGIFVRLKPGVSLERVRDELRPIYRALHPAGESRDFEPIVLELHGEFTFLASRTLRTTLLLVFGAVLVLVLIACLNVANLFMARLSERRRELAVRVALGSGQGRLIRQLLVEGMLLSGSGAILGLGFAFVAVRLFRAADPIELSPGADVRINPTVLAFGALLSLLTAAIFATLPALRAARVDLSTRLKPARRTRLIHAIVSAEVALSFVLLTAAGLFLTSSLRMQSESPGFDPVGVIATRISLPASRYPTGPLRLAAWDRLLDRTPGAALASRVPPDGRAGQLLEVDGRPSSGIHDTSAEAVSPGFFDVLRVPVFRGRRFDAQDRENTLPVTIVNQALAEKYFRGSDPIGHTIRLSNGSTPWLTIVGVCGNLKQTELMNEMRWVEEPILYRPLGQDPRGTLEVVARGVAPSDLQRHLAEFDPGIPVDEPEPVRARLAKPLAYPRFRAAVFAAFGLSALLLAAVGLYGVLSRFVAQRTPEFGVRRAVGAQTRHLLLLVGIQGGAPVFVGLAAGAGLAMAARRFVSALLYGIPPADPAALTVVSGVLIAVAAVSILVPAVRAARVDPMAALREQ